MNYLVQSSELLESLTVKINLPAFSAFCEPHHTPAGATESFGIPDPNSLGFNFSEYLNGHAN